MYASLPEDIRDKHPYHMYEEIRAQPDAVRRSLEVARERGTPVVDLIGRARRVFVTGCGTSFHAARCGAWFLSAFSHGKIDALPVQAYELLTYTADLRPDDLIVGVTHSGGTMMTLQALEHARNSGCDTVALTGFPESPVADVAGHVLPTGYSDERSWAHTVSYLAAITTMAALANALAEDGERLDLSVLPEAVADALALEEMAHRLAGGAIVAERFREPTNYVVIGAGPNAITAQECVLKLLETSYVMASAFELEEVLHGPLAAVTEETMGIVIAPPGRSTERASELVRALVSIGTAPIVLAGDENANAFEDAHRFLIPDVPEILSPIVSIVPLQLFSYFLAVGKGINPDLLHRDDERYRAARAAYR